MLRGHSQLVNGCWYSEDERGEIDADAFAPNVELLQALSADLTRTVAEALEAVGLPSVYWLLISLHRSRRIAHEEGRPHAAPHAVGRLLGFDALARELLQRPVEVLGRVATRP